MAQVFAAGMSCFACVLSLPSHKWTRKFNGVNFNDSERRERFWVFNPTLLQGISYNIVNRALESAGVEAWDPLWDSYNVVHRLLRGSAHLCLDGDVDPDEENEECCPSRFRSPGPTKLAFLGKLLVWPC